MSVKESKNYLQLKKNNRIRVFINILIVIFLIVFIVSLVLVVFTVYQYGRGDSFYKKAAEKYVVYLTEDEDTSENTETGENNASDKAYDSSSIYRKKAPVSVDFDELSKASDDVYGWLYCPGTVINYPVVRGEDNEFYLHHLIDGSYNYPGTIFADCRSEKDFKNSSEFNTILYGHNMKNGSMFGVLNSYRKQEFFDEHPAMYFLTPEGNYRLDVFSAYLTTSDSYVFNEFSDEKEFETYLKKSYSQSVISTPVSEDLVTRAVTLSTCAYDFTKARFVVNARVVPIE